MDQRQGDDQLRAENDELRRQLQLAKETIEAIRSGANDALRESEEQFHQLADSMPQLVWMAAPDGSIDWYNRRWYEYTGTTEQEMRGWGWERVHDPIVLPGVLAKWKASIASGDSFEMTFPLRGADGAFRPFLTRVVAVRDAQDRIVRWFGTNTDVSAEYEAQENLRQIAAKLSEEDRRKDEFLATLAHELRNPLSPIKTAAELIKIVDDDIDELRELGGVIDRQVTQMVRLIDDLLDVSRISRGQIKLRLDPCNLRDVIASAIEAAKPFIAKSDQQLHVDVIEDSLYVDGDCARLVQVVVNLLNNAGKYTPASGEIWLSVSRDDDRALIQVRDNGIGLRQDKLTAVFEMFEQADNEKERGQSGLGIGLSLVKTLINLHGGEVSAQSDGLGKGCTFSVRLPLVDPPQESGQDETPAEAEAPSRKFRILVVEDTRAIRYMLVRLLEQLGHEVAEAEDGKEGLEIALQFKPEVILSDISMPVMNGHEFAQQVCREVALNGVHLVALTGYGQEADQQNVRDSGFADHIVKPADAEVLKELFAKLSREMSPE